MMVCLPVKNGWQLPHTSTRSSGLVEPTVHSVPHDPQCTLASKYLGWISGFTCCSPPPPSARVRCPPVVAGAWVDWWSGLGRDGRRLDGLDPNPLLVLPGMLEVDPAGHGREDGVVVPKPRAGPGEERHAALPDDDRAGRDDLAVAGLHAQPLADAVAAVLDAAACLLVGHRRLLVLLGAAALWRRVFVGVGFGARARLLRSGSIGLCLRLRRRLGRRFGG